MAVPGHVRDLHDYWVWAERLFDESGGFLSLGFLELSPVEVGSDEWIQLIVPKQRLEFHDRSYLDFRFLVNRDLELIYYSFHYARWDGQLVFRLDRHASGHEQVDGGDSHIHLPGDERKPHGVIGLDDVLDLIKTDQADDRRPKTPR